MVFSQKDFQKTLHGNVQKYRHLDETYLLFTFTQPLDKPENKVHFSLQLWLWQEFGFQSAEVDTRSSLSVFVQNRSVHRSLHWFTHCWRNVCENREEIWRPWTGFGVFFLHFDAGVKQESGHRTWDRILSKFNFYFLNFSKHINYIVIMLPLQNMQIAKESEELPNAFIPPKLSLFKL